MTGYDDLRTALMDRNAPPDASLDEQCGRWARSLRHSNNLTISDAAKKLGLSRSYLSYLEAGQRSWNASLLEKFERVLK